MYFRSNQAQLETDNDGEEAHYSCRICFEDAKPSELISPCKCKGTLKYVHRSCLHKWQANAQKLGGKRDERATVCGVCRTRYTSLLPTAALHFWRKVFAVASTLIGASCISLLALCLSGPPLLHFALLLLLLLSTRSQSLLAVLLLLLGCVMASLYARGLRLVMRMDGEVQFGLALIRQGAPIDGLQPGSLLVAHQSSLDGTMFAQSVILITEKNNRGTKGVMLTQPMETVDAQLLRYNHVTSMLQSPSNNPVTKHYLGGPVGLPTASQIAAAAAATQLVVLHHMAAVPGAAAIIAAEEPEQQQQQQQQYMEAAAVHRDSRRYTCSSVWQQITTLCRGFSRQQQQQPHSNGPTRAIVPSSSSSSSSTGAVHAGSTTASSYADLALYQGGSLDVLLQAVQQASGTAAAATAAAPKKGLLASKFRWQIQRNTARRHGSSSSSSDHHAMRDVADADVAQLRGVIRMYHGVCTWSAGQLEGEIRSGSWGVVTAAQIDDIVSTRPDLVWEALLNSNRVKWF